MKRNFVSTVVVCMLLAHAAEGKDPEFHRDFARETMWAGNDIALVRVGANWPTSELIRAYSDKPIAQVVKLNSARLINEMGELQKVKEGETRITDAGLKEIKKLTNVRDLSLNGAAVTDAGLKDLSGLTNLRWLRLNHTAISYAGLNELAKLTNLDYIEFFETKAHGRQGNDWRMGLPEAGK